MIKTILLIAIGIIIISYFGIDIKRAVESPQTQQNFSYVTRVGVTVWNGYLKKPVTYIWNEVFLKLIWKTAEENIKSIETATTTKSTILNKAP